MDKKFFPKQSGEIRAIKEGVQDIKKMALSVVEEVKSNPPPGLFRKLSLPVTAGEYSLTSTQDPSGNLTDQVGEIPAVKVPKEESFSEDEAETLRQAT